MVGRVSSGIPFIPVYRLPSKKAEFNGIYSKTIAWNTGTLEFIPALTIINILIPLETLTASDKI